MTLLLTVIATVAMGQGMVETYKDFIGSAKAGNAESQYYVGLCLEQGKSVIRDISQAISWYRKASEINDENEEALFMLAKCYENGLGVQQDYIKNSLLPKSNRYGLSRGG